MTERITRKRTKKIEPLKKKKRVPLKEKTPLKRKSPPKPKPADWQKTKKNKK